MRNRKLFVLPLLLSCLLLGTGSTALAISPGSPGDGGLPVTLTTVLHYPHRPDVVFSGIEGQPLVAQIGYIVGSNHWANPVVPYYVNIGRQDAAFITGIEAAFDTWDGASGCYAPVYSGLTRSRPGTRQVKWKNRLDGFTGAVNTIGFKDLSEDYTGAIAVTYMWNSGTSLIEVDTALNLDSFFSWWQTELTGDPNYAVWPPSQVSDAYDVDVQNIMTHEAGHWLVLDDIYNATPGFRGGDENLTMYGYAAENELKKRSLEFGDVFGIRLIYGA